MIELKIGDYEKTIGYCAFNPAEKIIKGSIAKKVAMEYLQPFTREISGYEFAPFSGGSKFRNGDTLMARITPCLENGKTAYVSILDDGEIGFSSTEYIVFRNIEGVTDSKFVYYFVTNPWFRNIAIKSMVGSSGRQRVQLPVLENLEVHLPPLTEQKRIAGILGALDDKIELNRRINANLEQQAQTLFKQWFIENNDDFNSGKLGDIIEIFDSQRKPLSGNERDKMQKIYPYYGAATLMDYIDDYLFDGIYLLLGEDGTVVTNEGFPVLQYVEGKFWVNNHAHILQGKNGFSVEVLYILLSQTNIQSIITGAVQPKISQYNLRNLQIPILPIDKVKSYDDIIQPMFRQIRKNYKENCALELLRDTLLPKLMNGEMDIKGESDYL